MRSVAEPCCSEALLGLLAVHSERPLARAPAEARARHGGERLLLALLVACLRLSRVGADSALPRERDRGVELGAAVLVMLFGLALLTGYLSSERLLPG